MEIDIVRPSGDDTRVDLWLEGSFRAISVTKRAIEAYLGVWPQDGASESPKDRCEFVRTHLGVISRAVLMELRANSTKHQFIVGSGQLQRHEVPVAA